MLKVKMKSETKTEKRVTFKKKVKVKNTVFPQVASPLAFNGLWEI